MKRVKKNDVYSISVVGKPASGVEDPTAAGGSKGSLTSASEEFVDDRGSWSNQCEFILTCLGFAVGFGNVWRFPYLCYKNGGAAFLIPYFTMLVCAGLPMFFMELAVGQYVSLGPNMLYSNLAPLFSGLGWAMPLVSFYVSVYFDVIMAWSLFYTFHSFTAELPWGRCDNPFSSPECATVSDINNCTQSELFYYNNTCHNITDICTIGGYDDNNGTHCTDDANNMISPPEAVHRVSSSEDYYRNGLLGVQGTSWEDMGALRWDLVGYLALGWVVVGGCLVKGIKSSGKASYFTALFPYVVLTILFVRGITLEGAYKGIEFYFLRPNLTKLKEAVVWNDAASQIFFSLGSSFGSLITLASYNKFNNNCMRDALIVSSANCLTSVYAGFVIFSILGSLALELGVEVEDVVTSKSGLAFIAYPQAVLSMPAPQLWAVLFFVMLLTMGVSSQFAMVETVNTAIFDQWPNLRKKKPIVVAAVCFTMFLVGVPMCLEGGVYIFEIFNLYSAGISVMILAIVEVILLQYVYGHKKFIGHIKNEFGIWMPLPLELYWKVTWLFVTPVSLLMILVMSVTFWEPAYFGSYKLPYNAQVFGWIVCASSVSLIFFLGAYVLIKGDYRGKDLMRPTPIFCPAKERRQRKHAERVERFCYTNAMFDGQQTLERRTSRERKESKPKCLDQKVTSF